MPYPEALVTPMRQELTRLGVRELANAAEVDEAMREAEEGTTVVVINSVCGCAAANARPAIALARQSPVQPDRYVTVFAGQDLDATVRMREYLPGIPPSSPFIALFKDGDPAYVIERRHIEGRSASAIAADLAQAFGRFCGTQDEGTSGVERPETSDVEERDQLPPSFKSIL